MKSALPGIAKFLFVVFCLVFAAYQLYDFIVASVETEIAEYVTVEKAERAEGFFVRNEVLINSQTGGEIYFTVADGERVKNGTKLAEIYLSSNNIAVKRNTDETEKKVNVLQTVKTSVGYFDIDTNKTDKLIRDKMTELIFSKNTMNTMNARNMRLDLAALASKKQIILEGVSELDKKLAELKGLLQNLKAQQTAPDETLYSKSSGYFVGSADGFETLLSPETSLSMTVSEFLNLEKLAKDVTPATGAVCKLLPEYEWYFITALDVSQSEGLVKDSTISIRFPFVSEDIIKVKIISISSTYEGLKTVVFKGTEIKPQLNHLRYQTVEIIKATYSGLKIPEAAVKIVDGETGVFVRIGDEVKYRTVTSIYKKDSYFVVAPKNEGKTGYIKPFDEIIVKGVDLHEGKIIK